MSIATDTKIRELEERVSKLETEKSDSNSDSKSDSLSLEKLWGEIKTIKMRMARNDGKRTPSAD